MNLMNTVQYIFSNNWVNGKDITEDLMMRLCAGW